MHPLNESCYAGSELCRELACSRPPLKNASDLCDMLLEIEDILRVLDRRLMSCEQPRWDVAQSHSPPRSLQVQENHQSRLSDQELGHHPKSFRGRSKRV